MRPTIGEQIAKAIERERIHHLGDCVCVICGAYRTAARIARAPRVGDAPSAGCFTPPTAEELVALPRCATCGGVYPLECPPHVPASSESS